MVKADTYKRSNIEFSHRGAESTSLAFPLHPLKGGEHQAASFYGKGTRRCPVSWEGANLFLRMPKGFKSIFLPVFVATFVVMLLMQARPVFADTQAPVISPSGGSFTTVPERDHQQHTRRGYCLLHHRRSNPETSSTAITYSARFTVSQSETVQAAVHDPTSGWSGVTSATFDINSSSQAPVISPSGGSFTTAQSVTISNIIRHRLLHHRRHQSGDQQHAHRLHRAIHGKPVRNGGCRQ